MKSVFYKYIAVLVLAGCAASCADKNERNYQYFPDMYVPVSYEAYGAYDIFQNEQEAKHPVEGSIPRGWMPYEYPETAEGKANAKANLQNPLPYTENNLNSGEQLYTIYCSICHGDKGNGKGVLVEREKILGVPAYNDEGRAITEGDVYHTMYYGLNNMGSYAAQTSIKERWQIAHYVMSLKRELNGAEKRPFVEGDKEQQAQPNNEGEGNEKQQDNMGMNSPSTASAENETSKNQE